VDYTKPLPLIPCRGARRRRDHAADRTADIINPIRLGQ
jgi:hypothetical protein